MAKSGDAICPQEMATRLWLITPFLSVWRQVFKVSEGCYRCQPVLADETRRLPTGCCVTANQRNWGFGLCPVPA